MDDCIRQRCWLEFEIPGEGYPAGIRTSETLREVWGSNFDLGNQWLMISHWNNESVGICPRGCQSNDSGCEMDSES